MKFPSAVDQWFYWLVLVFPTLLLIWVATQLGSESTSIWLIFGGTVLITLGIPLWMLLTTCYIVDSGNLTIKSGPLSWVIPKDKIESVKPSSSLLSSPALSLKRLEVRYSGGRSILISPKDQEGFLQAIDKTRT